MQAIQTSFQRFRHPEFWVIASVVMILPPAYFWLFGLLHALGVDISIAGDLLGRLPEIAGAFLVFILPFFALLTSYVCYQLMRNAFSTLLLVLSMALVVASVSTLIF